MSQVPGAAARPVSVRPTTSPNAGHGVPGESAAAPVHQSKAEVADTARTALRLEPLPSRVGNASVLDVPHTTRGTP
jgi:hypothetical protein